MEQGVERVHLIGAINLEEAPGHNWETVAAGDGGSQAKVIKHMYLNVYIYIIHPCNQVIVVLMLTMMLYYSYLALLREGTQPLV